MGSYGFGVSMKGKDYFNRGMINSRNFDDIDYTGYQAYEEYIAWANFQKNYPWNTKLLEKLFGSRDSMDIFRYMRPLPESKARELVERLEIKSVKKGVLVLARLQHKLLQSSARDLERFIPINALNVSDLIWLIDFSTISI